MVITGLAAGAAAVVGAAATAVVPAGDAAALADTVPVVGAALAAALAAPVVGAAPVDAALVGAALIKAAVGVVIMTRAPPALVGAAVGETATASPPHAARIAAPAPATDTPSIRRRETRRCRFHVSTPVVSIAIWFPLYAAYCVLPMPDAR